MKIDIVDSDFARLQALAEPFVDTPATVVTRLLDAFENTSDVSTPKIIEKQENVFTVENIPPLTHTKVMAGSFSSKRPPKENWDAYVRLALIEVRTASNSVEELRRRSGANVRSGSHTDSGYKPVTGYDFSFQGVSAEDAIKIIARCARSLGVSFEIEFVWRDKMDAHLPGQRGKIVLD